LALPRDGTGKENMLELHVLVVHAYPAEESAQPGFARSLSVARRGAASLADL
jgi:hypothetical protein